MQLVIDISETLKGIADDEDGKTFSHVMWQAILMDAIKNGIPLPKEHGRLIDADKFLKDNEAYTGWILDSSDWGGKNAYKDTLEDLVNEAPTIIEAAGGEEDGK